MSLKNRTPSLYIPTGNTGSVEYYTPVVQFHEIQ